MPKELRDKLLRSKNSVEQVVVVLECQSARTSSVQVRSLHQRDLVNVEECTTIEELLCASNNNLGTTCFEFHTDDIMLGKHDCLDLSKVFLVRHIMIPHSTGVSQIQDFKSFSDECSDFLSHHTSDLARIV